MTDLWPYIKSIAVLAAFALVWGGIVLVRRGQERRKGMLMLIAAAVLLANIAIAAWPPATGLASQHAQP